MQKNLFDLKEDFLSCLHPHMTLAFNSEYTFQTFTFANLEILHCREGLKMISCKSLDLN